MSSLPPGSTLRWCALLAVVSGLAVALPERARGDETVFLAGRIDAYDESDGPELSSPSPGFDARLTGPRRTFDDTSVNTELLHTFDLSDLQGTITGAVLTARLRPNAEYDQGSVVINDSVGLTFTGPAGQAVAGSPTWVRQLGDCSAFGNCGNPEDHGLQTVLWSKSEIVAAYGPDGYTLVLDLSALPKTDGSTTGLVDDLNTYGLLDTWVQDDTNVDYIQLAVTHRKPQVCIDLGRPTGEDRGQLGGIDTDVGIGVTVGRELAASAIGVYLGTTATVDLEVTVNTLLSDGSLGGVVATASQTVGPEAPRWVNVPVGVTFHPGTRYAIRFDRVGGGSGVRPYSMEYSSHHNPTLDPQLAYAAPPFEVLDGRSGISGWGNFFTPHFRVCYDLEDLPRVSGCDDLGHPPELFTAWDDSERGVGVEMIAPASVRAFGSYLQPLESFEYQVTLRALSGTTAGPILSRRTVNVVPGHAHFVDLPVEASLLAGLRYEIDFDLPHGIREPRPYLLRYFLFDNTSLAYSGGFDAGAFRVLDGRNQNSGWGNGLLTHVRACASDGTSAKVPSMALPGTLCLVVLLLGSALALRRRRDAGVVEEAHSRARR